MTHDRYFLDNLHRLDAGARPRPGRPLQGQLLELARAEGQARRSREIRRGRPPEADGTRELEWIRSSPRARQAKSKARVSAYDKLVEQAGREEVGQASFSIAAGPRLGELVVEVEGLSKAFGDRLLIDNLPPAAARRHCRRHRPQRRRQDDAVQDDDRARRSRTAARSSSARRSKLAYVDQSRDHLDDKKTVWQEISGGLDIMKFGDKKEMSSRAYCGWFNFKGPDQQKKVGLLSGGERNRVPPRQDAEEGRQPASARRADQRPRHRDAAARSKQRSRTSRLRRGHLT